MAPFLANPRSVSEPDPAPEFAPSRFVRERRPARRRVDRGTVKTWLSLARQGASWLSCAAMANLGCQSIAGIEDRTLGSSAACEDYCSGMQASCVGDSNPYYTTQACLGVCQLLEPGDAVEPAGNTLGCRARALEEAALEPETFCGVAGPGGKRSGMLSCGGECESYCRLFSLACSRDFEQDFESHAACMEKCAAVRSDSGFGAEAHYRGDTLQCRLVHLSAATVTPAPHCEHARIVPVDPCVDDPNAEPSCEDYCRIVMVACVDYPVYESSQQCVRACDALGATLGYGVNEDRSENSIGCRKYHAYNSLLGAKTHCAHAGPTGDGHCFNEDADAGNCQSYCAIMASACPAAFGATAACQNECMALEGHLADSHYSVTGAGADTQLGCRMKYALSALDDASQCPAASGLGSCP